MKQPSKFKRRLAWILWIVIVAAMLTTIVTIEAPTQEDLEAYGRSVTSTIDGFKGSEAGENILRTKAHELMKEFTDYPLRLKVLHLVPSG
jgi:hypothetical protein